MQRYGSGRSWPFASTATDLPDIMERASHPASFSLEDRVTAVIPHRDCSTAALMESPSTPEILGIDWPLHWLITKRERGEELTGWGVMSRSRQVLEPDKHCIQVLCTCRE